MLQCSSLRVGSCAARQKNALLLLNAEIIVAVTTTGHWAGVTYVSVLPWASSRYNSAFRIMSRSLGALAYTVAQCSDCQLKS